jgi:hypothetical protein
MQCNEVEQLLIDFLDGQLHPADEEALQKHLQTCEACVNVLEQYKMLFRSIEENKFENPGPALREKFDIMLQSEINIYKTSRTLPETEGEKVIPIKKYSLWLRIAASIILLASGIWIGSKVTPTSNDSEQIAQLRSQVNDVKEVLTLNLLNEESASERIRAVNYAEEINNPDEKIVTALIATMNEDKNVNVRLTALYALARFSDKTAVTDSLIVSLKKQTDPIMQIALINILTEKKETKAKELIREILLDKNTLKPVKDIAQKGLNLL